MGRDGRIALFHASWAGGLSLSLADYYAQASLRLSPAGQPYDWAQVRASRPQIPTSSICIFCCLKNGTPE